MHAIDIRPLSTLEEIEQLEELQRVTWGMSDLEVIPARMLHALAHQGAVLLGAVDGEKVVGFVLGVIGTVQELTERIDQVAAARLKMYSVIMGVLPDYQSYGLGYQLKLAQRESALKLGIRLVTWTYDPLEARNARLNIGKLGTICRQYWRNFHGEMEGINAGLPTDRFHVEWWVTSNRVKSRVQQRRGPLDFASLVAGGATLVNEVQFEPDQPPVPPATLPLIEGEILQNNMVMVEIPYNFQAIKQQDMEAAQRWRRHTRSLFEQLFAANFVATDFIFHQDDDGQRRGFYLLTHQDAG